MNQTSNSIANLALIGTLFNISLGTALATTGHYTNSNGDRISSLVKSITVPKGTTARCKDGTYSISKHRSSTCPGYKGVGEWL